MGCQGAIAGDPAGELLGHRAAQPFAAGGDTEDPCQGGAATRPDKGRRA